MEKSAVVEHVWENTTQIHWEETALLDHGSGTGNYLCVALAIYSFSICETHNSTFLVIMICCTVWHKIIKFHS